MENHHTVCPPYPAAEARVCAAGVGGKIPPMFSPADFDACMTMVPSRSYAQAAGHLPCFWARQLAMRSQAPSPPLLACCTAIDSMPHHLRVHPDFAARRTAGGALQARARARRTPSRGHCWTCRGDRVRRRRPRPGPGGLVGRTWSPVGHSVGSSGVLGRMGGLIARSACQIAGLGRAMRAMFGRGWSRQLGHYCRQKESWEKGRHRNDLTGGLPAASRPQ